MITAVGATVDQVGVTENTAGFAVEKAAVKVNVPESQVVPIVPPVVCCFTVPPVFSAEATNTSVIEQLWGVLCVVST